MCHPIRDCNVYVGNSSHAHTFALHNRFATIQRFRIHTIFDYCMFRIIVVQRLCVTLRLVGNVLVMEVNMMLCIIILINVGSRF